MFERISGAIRRFMTGRNGVDTLAWALCILGILLNLIGNLTRQAAFTLLAYIPLILSLFRIFSRDTQRRSQENEKFRQFFFRLRNRRDYSYFKCPACKTRVRVPRGKGKIKITCPSCREIFIRKT